MKNHRFLWLRNRTTDNRKCEKARNIKEKRTIEMFNTVSKQLVVHHSSQRDNYLAREFQSQEITSLRNYGFWGFFNAKKIYKEYLYHWPNDREALIFSRENGVYEFRENVNEQVTETFLKPIKEVKIDAA